MIERISVHELQDMLARGERPYLVDVRTPEEFERVRVRGARLVPLAMLPLEEARIPKNRPIYFLCHSGARSAQAARWLKAKRPHQRCVNIEGGIVAWAQAGYALEFDHEEETQWG